MCVQMHLYVFTEGSVCVYRGICMCVQMDLYVCRSWAPQGLMRLTRLRADSRGTPTARERQCRMSKKGQEENKDTQNTQIDLNKWKLGWTLSLPQTSRANPVQCCSTHQKKNASVCAYRCICMCSLKKTLFWRDMSFEGIYICVPSQRAFFEGMSFEETYVQCTCVL